MKIQVGEILDACDVVSFVENIHYRKEDFEEGDIAEQIEKYPYYQLREVLLSEIESVWTAIHEDLIEEYKEDNEDTMPPIVLGHHNGTVYDITDGGHRVEVLRAQNKDRLMALVPCNRFEALNK